MQRRKETNTPQHEQQQWHHSLPATAQGFNPGKPNNRNAATDRHSHILSSHSNRVNGNTRNSSNSINLDSNSTAANFVVTPTPGRYAFFTPGLSHSDPLDRSPSVSLTPQATHSISLSHYDLAHGGDDGSAGGDGSMHVRFGEGATDGGSTTPGTDTGRGCGRGFGTQYDNEFEYQNARASASASTGQDRRQHRHHGGSGDGGGDKVDVLPMDGESGGGVGYVASPLREQRMHAQVQAQQAKQAEMLQARIDHDVQQRLGR